MAPPFKQTFADTIYSRFFKGGIAVVLTAGAVWGALLLLRIAFAGSFTAISIHEINAHGHAQIFGWVGLFVMGFAYQAFPRMLHTSLRRPDLANLSFYLMITGILARVVGEPLHEIAVLKTLAFAGAVAEIAAIGLFVAVILSTHRQASPAWRWADAYIGAALGFFFIQAVYELALLAGTTSAASRDALLSIVATFQAPLRDLQIHGFALFIILGVSLRMVPALFGLRERSTRLAKAAWFLLLAGVLGEIAVYITMRLAENRVWAAPWYAAIFCLATACVLLTWRWLPFFRPGEPDRSAKFVQTAMIWLNLSMLMLLLAPVYTYALLPAVKNLSAGGRQAAEIGFSHAYYGAIRHAITVGFISLMILGMGAKVVPTLKGIDIRRLRALWVPFVLVNLGCAMRVGFQVSTDFTQATYSLVGVSGLLEVTGIAVWGVHLWRILNGWAPGEELARAQVSLPITPEDRVGAVVGCFPETLGVFKRHGFTPLANPILRRTVARSVTLRTAAAYRSRNVDALVAELNQAAAHKSGP
ncbi:MAG: DUF1858 domain-containing protein [Candidatus Eisenbacteria bacterium]|nr:DUF1858 domain-containing protein [Candidatus Eisenbacteria bacterium]